VFELLRQLRSETAFTKSEDKITFLLEKLRFHDEATYFHSIRVANILDDFAKDISIDIEERKQIKNSALLHDIGKLVINKSLLQKEGKLNKLEWEELKKHALYGDFIVESLEIEDVDQSMILHHHENVDGSGYIGGLKENDISFNVRMIRIVDSFEAMTANRTYSEAKSIEEALIELRACKQFYDQELVEKFINFIEELNMNECNYK
jgi:HD-GYP domain-containing protein (c-di-GMP phosphodiesterase class II)